MNQKRTPRGISTGGQFEGNDHDEASHAMKRAFFRDED